MRNPFARLAKRDVARPSLRERAAVLKASAARVIRRKPVATPTADLSSPALADAVSPDLAAMVAEWAVLAEEQEDVSFSDEESGAIGERWADLQAEICRFPARSLADMCAKAPVYEYARGLGRLKRLRCKLLTEAGHEAGRGNVITATVLVALYVVAC